MHWWKVAELEEVLELDEAAIKVAEEKEKLIVVQAEVKKSKVIAEVKLKAIKKFKASKDFEAKVTEGSSMAYEYGFRACKALVSWLLLGVNLSCLQPKNNDDEVEEDPAMPLTLVVEAPAFEPIIEVITKLAAKNITKDYVEPTIIDVT
ncbi:hypothetical protein COCNU_04G009300 [Cocos nucifera]|uniref:Uncharacterized protein n=1 Tax=Cocos nucifera TaxID=13894 RepID=A0A8K0I756_COCNU|nr:hypothetical protein COCNU_04G009300 [Cocos nucifera]